MTTKHSFAKLSLIVIILTLTSISQSAFAGYLAAWGRNNYGQTWVPEGDDYVDVACGSLFNIALKSDGTIIAWGNNTYDQSDEPAGSDYTTIAAGSRHGLGLDSSGELTAWGYNTYGQATALSGTYTAIAASDKFSLAISTDGSIVGFGTNYYGETSVPSGNNYVAIAAADYQAAALTSTGRIVAWGDDIWGISSYVPTNTGFTSLALGLKFGAAVDSDGDIVIWGNETSTLIEAPLGSNFVDISVFENHLFGLTDDGQLVYWDQNGNDTYSLIDIPELENGDYWADIATGKYHAIGIAVPEPATVALLSFGILTIRKKLLNRA